MNVLSLFSGCLGLDLGLEALGLDAVAYCEIDPWCRKVIRARRPDVPLVADVHDLNPVVIDEVDVIVGGFPCQDLSYAGKGAGLDGEHSGLWFEMARCIRVLRPRFVLVENVPALATRGLGRVLYDLADDGYVGSWLRLRAADIGAPHIRERLFVIAADTKVVGRDARRAVPVPESGGRSAPAGGGAAIPDADRRRLEGEWIAQLGGLKRAPRRIADGRSEVRQLADGEDLDWGEYGRAVRRWERLFGRAAPRPTDHRGRLNPRFVEWMLGFPDGWVDVDGVSSAQQLRMLGNAVQVQCGTAVGRLLLQQFESQGRVPEAVSATRETEY